MRNREAILRKLDSVESNLSKIVLSLNRGDRESCYEIIEYILEQTDQIKGYIESNPISGEELNP